MNKTFKEVNKQVIYLDKLMQKIDNNELDTEELEVLVKNFNRMSNYIGAVRKRNFHNEEVDSIGKSILASKQHSSLI